MADARLLCAGVIVPEGDTLGARAIDLFENAWDVVWGEGRWSQEGPKDASGRHGPHRLAVVVETPFESRRPPSGAARSVVTLPVYGVAVGMVLGAAHKLVHQNNMDTLLTVPSDEWPRGWAPPVKGDDYKTARVEFVNGLYGLDLVEQGGSKSKAADMADAILLAHWGRQRATQAAIVIGFDPSMSCTGYAAVAGEAMKG